MANKNITSIESFVSLKDDNKISIYIEFFGFEAIGKKSKEDLTHDQRVSESVMRNVEKLFSKTITVSNNSTKAKAAIVKYLSDINQLQHLDKVWLEVADQIESL